MVMNHGANLIITDWIDDHSEMLSEWEAETRYNMDFLVEKRKLVLSGNRAVFSHNTENIKQGR
ncbi:MAG: hypothetical protein ACI4D3_00870 [Lachnospiraceae bacterium]